MSGNLLARGGGGGGGGERSEVAAVLTPGQLAPVLGFYSAVGLRWSDPRVAPAQWVVPGGLPGLST